MNDNSPYIVYYALGAVFVASALFGMRQPIGKTLKMALAWVLIFAIGFTFFAFRSELWALGQRLRAEATGTPVVQGQTVRIPISDDGHFWVMGKINGRDVRFMVDSGASVTTVSKDFAKSAGMTIENHRRLVSTANGPSWVNQGWADRLEIGSIIRSDFPVDVSDQRDMNLLGMNFLSSLNGWRVEGNYLVLQP